MYVQRNKQVGARELQEQQTRSRNAVSTPFGYGRHPDFAQLGSRCRSAKGIDHGASVRVSIQERIHAAMLGVPYMKSKAFLTPIQLGFPNDDTSRTPGTGNEVAA